ncbi:conserved hypothetical protein (plasmid) [Polaromonas naphthalenivorans CJ2]|uniref:Uncharacterized protein n=1 Tax=Polaromonas naphthalenivorans (strain CJ2) TaxID=365044 RepID=A1VVR0_POLNA|nr:conserved hypothetical protein [Polaromonas naphthalenivorans CJ2]
MDRIADEERPKKKVLETHSLASVGRSPIGQKHARLTIISRVKKSSSYFTYYNCLCDCGNQYVTTLFRMKSGRTKSCGCLHRKACPELRVTGTREHNSWVSMKQRCNYKDHTEYHLYGGRGIKVCARWNKSFKNFLADMGPRPEGKSLERIDTNGNYELLNCRWATAVEQNRNRRDNVIIEIGGVTACVTEWCEIFNLPKGRTFYRIRKGWSAHQSLFG